MACSSNCNNVVLKSEQILLEQWQLIQGCDINNHYMQYYIYSVSQIHRGYPSRSPPVPSERTGQLCVRTSASCTKPAHSHALSATAVCSSFFRFWPTTPADGSPLRKTAGALWNSSLATGRKAGAARKRKRSAQPVPAQSPSAVLEVA
ncbi:Hypothetical_protein [Hexamita inflata]|uniref:Hypothetical_protein n=1 Tax=Hexamita inflata TaxID=28002 RepID=A0AA86TIS8_9EUKA|nr:Hypothetical protein HINF_LOCUS7529 [Hexamita inflata]